jgi:hypothetical protein
MVKKHQAGGLAFPNGASDSANLWGSGAAPARQQRD